jgi:hypothetical protein
MGLIREPKNVDFSVQSKPWTEEELIEFRKLMTELKAKNTATKIRIIRRRKKTIPKQLVNSGSPEPKLSKP